MCGGEGLRSSDYDALSESNKASFLIRHSAEGDSEEKYYQNFVMVIEG